MSSLISAMMPAVQSSPSSVPFLAALASASEQKSAGNITTSHSAIDLRTISSDSTTDTRATTKASADREAQSASTKDEKSSHQTAGTSKGEEHKASPSDMSDGAATSHSSSDAPSGSSTVTKEKHGRVAASDGQERISLPAKTANSAPEVSVQMSRPYSAHSAALTNALDDTIAPGSSANSGTRLPSSAPVESSVTNKPDEKQAVSVLREDNGRKEDVSSGTLPASAKSMREKLIPAISTNNDGTKTSSRVSESNQIVSLQQAAQQPLDRGATAAQTITFIGQHYTSTNTGSIEDQNGLQSIHGSDGSIWPATSSEPFKPSAQAGDSQTYNAVHVLPQQSTAVQQVSDVSALPATAFIGQQYASKNIASTENQSGVQLAHESDGSTRPDGSSESSKPSAQSDDPQTSNAAHVLPQQLTTAQLVPDAPASSRSTVQPGQFDLAVSHAGATDADAALSLLQAGTVGVGPAVAPTPVGNSFPLSLDLTMIPAIPDNGIGAADASQPTTKAGQKDASTAANVKTQGSLDATSAGTDKTTTSTAGAHDASSHSAQSNSQSSHDPATDASQGTAATPRVMDSGAPQSTAAVMHAASTGDTTPHRAANIPTDTTRSGHDREVQTSIHADSSEPVAPSSINTARLIQSMSETEMRVGMHSSEFGEISIRTTVSQQQMLTQISLDHNELSQAISAHVATAQAKLGDEHGLHALIEINNQGASFAGNSGQSSPREQRTSTNSARSQSFTISSEVDKAVSLGALASAGSGRTLDIRA